MAIKLPQIGDIVISPHTKFKNQDGSDKFDLLECDGGNVDINTRPLLAEICGYTKGDITVSTDRQYSVVCYTGHPDGDGAESLDFQNLDYINHNQLYGKTYDLGKGAFGQNRTTQSPSIYTLPDTILPIEQLPFPVKIYAFNGNWPSDRADLDLEYQRSDGSVVLYLRIRTRSTYQVGISTSLDGITWVNHSLVGNGGIRVDNYLDIDSSGTIFKNTLAAAEGTQAFEIPDLDMYNVTQVRVNAECYSTYSSGSTLSRAYLHISTVEDNSKLPNISSIDPRVPYRIVSDLT